MTRPCPALGDRAGQAHTRLVLGQAFDFQAERALACHRQALALHRQIDNRDGECCTWDCLGDTYRHLGRPDQAIVCYRQGIRLFRELGNRPDLAVALTNLGDTLCATGQLPGARAAWQEAHVILDDLHDPGANQVLAKLSGLGAA